MLGIVPLREAIERHAGVVLGTAPVRRKPGVQIPCARPDIESGLEGRWSLNQTGPLTASGTPNTQPQPMIRPFLTSSLRRFLGCRYEHKARVISKPQNKPHGYSHTYKRPEIGAQEISEDNQEEL